MKEKKKKSEAKGKDTKNKKTNTKNANNKLIKKDTKMKFKYKHPKLAIALKILLVLIILLVVVGAGVIIGLIYGFFGDDLKIDLSKLTMIENTVIVDSNENVLAELNGKESRKIITLDEMSPYLPKAYLFHLAKECTISKYSSSLLKPTAVSTPDKSSWSPESFLTNNGLPTFVSDSLFSSCFSNIFFVSSIILIFSNKLISFFIFYPSFSFF